MPNFPWQNIRNVIVDEQPGLCTSARQDPSRWTLPPTEDINLLRKHNLPKQADRPVQTLLTIDANFPAIPVMRGLYLFDTV